MVRDPSLTVRAARLSDGGAIGLLLQAGLADAPSAEQEPDELGEDPVVVGADVVEAALAGDHVLVVAEGEEGLVGLARVQRRELARSRHVGELALLVHPAARREGVGRALARGAIQHATGPRGFLKITCRVAADDTALAATIASLGGWRRERVETGALARGGRVLDVEVWSLWAR